MVTDKKSNSKTKQKLLFIHHSGYIGGAGLSLLHILKSLKYLSIEVTVYCPSEPGDMLREIKKLGYECISEPKSIPILTHFSGSDRSILHYHTLRNFLDIVVRKKEIEDMIRVVSPDIIAVNSMTLSYIGKIAKSLGIKTVCFHRETYAKGWLGLRTNYIKATLSNDFDEVAFISQYDLNQSGSMNSNTHVITDKVILNEYCNKNSDRLIKKGNTIQILYTGGMSELKGAHILIEALSKCKNNIHLIFLQYNGPKKKKLLLDNSSIKEKLKYLLGLDYTAKVLSLIDKNNLWDRIHFYPATNDVAKYFISCDYVVFPSTSPHQARPIYEAGAAEKPIIITESENIAEFITNGENGYVFPNGNSDYLAELLNRLADDKELCEIMGENNYSKTVQNHNFITLQEELKRVFR
ncbi:glycosyltransferase family 4 protein [Bacillus timonensis]|nr:glycosyltransferase family 4 protein [Bacillus timonensis]